MSIGIIVATIEELIETKKIMKSLEEKKYYNLTFYTGKINEENTVLVQCGIGKVNAARTTQFMIDKFNVEKIINIGAAGGINPDLKVKDIVIGDKLVQYDFDISEGGNYEKGEIQGIGKFIESDKELVELCKKILENRKNLDFNIKIGTIATADIFCTDLEIAKKTRKEFNAECVEMEGAAIAQVCFLDKIPFLVIRGISDTPNGNNGIDYEMYCQEAARQATELLDEIFKKFE